MHHLLVASVVVLMGVSFLAGLVSLKERSRAKRFLWSAVGIVSFTAAGVAIMAFLFRLPHHPLWLMWAAGSLLTFGLGVWVALAILNKGPQSGELTIKQRLHFAAQIALPGWKTLDTTEFRGEDRKDASRVTVALTIAAILVVIPGIAIVLATSILMNIRGSQASDFISHAVGYYTLLVATAWTASYVVTILCVSLVQIIRGNGRGLTLSQVAISLGTWAGLGAAGGVFVGALIPLVVVPLASADLHFLGLSFDLHLLGVSLLDAISPSLLLEISAAGAIFGFLLGEVISLVDISEGEKNLYVKTCVPPLLFALVSTGLGRIGLTPGKLSTMLAEEYNKTVLGGKSPTGSDPFQTAISQGLDSREGWASVVVGFEAKGWNDIVDQHVFYLMTWIIAILVALFSLTVQIRAREVQLLEAHSSLSPSLAPAASGSAPAADSSASSSKADSKASLSSGVPSAILTPDSHEPDRDSLGGNKPLTTSKAGETTPSTEESSLPPQTQ